MKREVELGCRSTMDCLAAGLFSTAVSVDSRFVDSRFCGQPFLWTAVSADSRFCGQPFLRTAVSVGTVFFIVFPATAEIFRCTSFSAPAICFARHLNVYCCGGR